MKTLELGQEAQNILSDITSYVKSYQNSTDIMENAASDVMDGRWDNSDKGVSELKRKKIIVGVKEDGHHTWMLTEYGKQLVKNELNLQKAKANTPKPLSLIQEYAKLVLDTKHRGVVLCPSDLSPQEQLEQLKIAAKTLGLSAVCDREGLASTS